MEMIGNDLPCMTIHLYVHLIIPPNHRKYKESNWTSDALPMLFIMNYNNFLPKHHTFFVATDANFVIATLAIIKGTNLVLYYYRLYVRMSVSVRNNNPITGIYQQQLLNLLPDDSINELTDDCMLMPKRE